MSQFINRTFVIVLNHLFSLRLMHSLLGSTLLVYALAREIDSGNPSIPITAQPVIVRPSPSPSPSSAPALALDNTNENTSFGSMFWNWFNAQTALTLWLYFSIPVILIALLIRRYRRRRQLDNERREDTLEGNASTGHDMIQIDGSGNSIFTVT